MKTTESRPVNIARRLFTPPVPPKAPKSNETSKEVAYTLRVEDGVIHINNISGKAEGITYSLLAQNRDGSTKLMTRYVALAPFQVFDDEAEGLHVLAAWTKN